MSSEYDTSKRICYYTWLTSSSANRLTTNLAPQSLHSHTIILAILVPASDFPTAMFNPTPWLDASLDVCSKQ